MSADETMSGGEGGGDDVTAGEYVLGVQDQATRRAVEERMRRDDAFAARVAQWEADLSAFNENYDEVAAPANTFAGIEQRLFGRAEPSTAAGRLWQSAALWRALTFASLIVVAGLSVMTFGPEPADEGAPTLMAEMTAEDTTVNLIARYQAASGTIEITPVAASSAQPQSLELWLITGEDALPVSLGVLDASGHGRILVDETLRSEIHEGMVLAVSVEPEGGSPSGQPTGPVIAAGPAERP